MQYYGMPESVPGVCKNATIYKIANGYLVSYRPKQEAYVPPDAEKILENRKAALKEEIEKQALIYKAAAKAIQGSDSDDEWKGGDGTLDETISKIVGDEPQGFGPNYASGFVPAISDEARAFPTLVEALDFLKTVLE